MPMLITGDPLDALQAAIDGVLPAGSPERISFDATMVAVKASPESQAVRNAISQMCASLTPAPPTPAPPTPQPPTPAPQAPSTGVSTGAVVGIGAGAGVAGFLAGMMVGKGMKK